MLSAVRTLLWLLASWVLGLAAYAAALAGWRGEVLSLDNWRVIGAVTLVAWLLSSVLLGLPVLRLVGSRRGPVPAALAGVALAILPVWLTVGAWYGWHPRHLLNGEAAMLALLYGTSGLVLGLALARS